MTTVGTFYDAFCGIGGFRLPLEQLGWKCIGACDIDPHAREVYRVRFSEFPTHMDRDWETVVIHVFPP